MEKVTDEMSKIARKTKTETVSMKIITLVTLFFLPGTFIAVSGLLLICLVSRRTVASDFPNTGSYSHISPSMHSRTGRSKDFS